MSCLDYLSEDLRCARGIPVTPGFGKFFCEAGHEGCPLVMRVGPVSGDVAKRRSKWKSLSDRRRNYEMSAS